jgi:adenosyl cobinamide kinase/adenosyl cobinamide phosphate guanylyltransferase
MHVITGGAYNGKADWVKQTYELNKTSHTWISSYQRDPCPVDLTKHDKPFIILEGAEQWISQLIKEKNGAFSRDDGRTLIKKWRSWEENSAHQLIVIATDISKGIVPIKQADRMWRDVTGWFYQDLVKECERFDVIWYGINKQLKGWNGQ